MHDDFNLTGLSAQVPYYEYALDTILDAESAQAARFSKDQQEAIESAAELLYGLIHARYIITPRGLAAMLEKVRAPPASSARPPLLPCTAHKVALTSRAPRRASPARPQYKMVHFGRCPRVHCQGQPALPVGQSDLPRMHTTKIFCCRCEDIYYPRSSRQANVDGAYFGTTFCHLFLQSYWELQPQPATSVYVPRIFGFKIHRPQGPPPTSAGRAAAIEHAGGASSSRAGAPGGAATPEAHGSGRGERARERRSHDGGDEGDTPRADGQQQQQPAERSGGGSSRARGGGSHGAVRGGRPRAVDW